jgi:hypothetical protein
LQSLIPEFNGDGHLPPGRYRTTLELVEATFVADERFAGSTTRSPLFDGLLRYFADWELVQSATNADSPILKAVWIAGSFASSAIDPGDIDVTPILDGVVADAVAGRPGSGGIRSLTRHRNSVKARYGVEIFPVRWHPIEHPFDNNVDLTGDEAAYLSDRGKMDDWWQRCRVDGQDIPTIESCEARRGYLEVIV